MSGLAPMQSKIKDNIKCGKKGNTCNKDDQQKYICMADKLGPLPVGLNSANTFMSAAFVRVGDRTTVHYDNSKFQYLNESSPPGDTVRNNCIDRKIPWGETKLDTVLVENPHVNWFRKNTN